MPDCPTYVARDHHQLGADGGRYGNVGCTPESFGRSLDGATCGRWKLTGAQIRAASNEPVPSKTSPGLNMEQGDDAVFRLTHGEVNFDTRRMYAATSAIDRILEGEYAVIQYQRSAQIAMGKGGGVRFGGAHAGSIDGVGGLHLSDNLVGRTPLTPAQAMTLFGSLVLEFRDGHVGPIGRGNAYVSFAPDNTIDWHVSIPKPPRDGKRHEFGLYVVDPVRRTVIRSEADHFTRGFSANTTSARRFGWAGHTSQSLVMLLDGSLAAQGRNRGLTYAVRSTYAVKGGI